MDDYAVVLNAGSSSLKFCVYRRPGNEAWRLEARGQIEGIGTSPRFSAKGAQGDKLADDALGSEVHDGRSALDSLAAWLGSRYKGARVLGIGHRVVHGGARYAGPTLVTPDVLNELRELIPLAPLHQPHNLAAIDAVSERLPDVPQVACFDTSFHRGQPAVAELVPLPGDIRRNPVFSATVFTACPTSTSRRSCRRSHRRSPRGASSWLTWVVAPACARSRMERVSTAASVSQPSMASAWERGRAPSIPAWSFISFRVWDSRPATSKLSSTRNRVYSASPASAMTCASCWRALTRLHVLPWITSCIEPPRRSERSPRSSSGIDALVFTAGIGENSPEIRRRVCDASSWLGIDLDEDANSRKGPRISRAGSRVSAWVIPTNEELMIARHMGAILSLAGARS